MSLNPKRWFCLTAFLLVVISTAAGQPVRHLDQKFVPPEPGSYEQWLGRSHWLRARILASAGLSPMPNRLPVLPRTGEVIEHDDYSVQPVALETLPGFYLTGNLYRPRRGAGPFPAVLTAHGHWENGRLENTDQASIPGRSINLARQGFVVFSYSMVGYNENQGLIPHRFSSPQYALWGFTVSGLQLWNSLRALDYLVSLPDVDSTRIGMTGASGGGTQTFLLTAVDDRVRTAAPVNMISLIMQGGCVCENPPLLRIDANNVEIGALTAPRPLLMVSATGDWTRNTPASEYPAMQQYFRLFGAVDRVANVHLDYPHNYNRDSREAMYTWFGKWLRKTTGAVREQAFQVDPDTLLLATLPAAPAPLDTLFARWKNDSRLRLGSELPHDWDTLERYRERWGSALQQILAAPREITHAEPVEHAPVLRTTALPGILIVHTGEQKEAARTIALEYVRKGYLAFTLAPFPHATTVPDSIAHFTTYNLTDDARRVEDIRWAARQIMARPDVTGLTEIRALAGLAPHTMLAMTDLPDTPMASLDFGNRAFDEDGDFLQSLNIPLLRRIGDLTTAAAMIAPARLTIYNLPEGLLRRNLPRIYAAAGASARVHIE